MKNASRNRNGNRDRLWQSQLEESHVESNTETADDERDDGAVRIEKLEHDARVVVLTCSVSGSGLEVAGSW